MKISKLESALILTEALVELGPHAHEKEIYDEVYAFLEYAEGQEQDESTEDARVRAYHEQFADDELDEEDEYELTPGYDYQAALDQFDKEYVDEMDAEFSPFSPSVGTTEPDALMTLMQGRVAPPTRGREIDRFIERAPVAERVHVPFKGVGDIFSSTRIVSEAFTPCGAD